MAGTNGRKPPKTVRTNSSGTPVKADGCLPAFAFLALPVGALLPLGHAMGLY